jgi:SAM-dependent methyltransferase
MSADRYADAAEGWAAGASLVYGPLAAELVGRSPHRLAGRRVLDAGAGTGLGSAALLAAGARPVALDRSHDMLRWDRARRPPALVADVLRLPLRDRAVDDTLAAFVLNHLREPVAGMCELARVTRPGGAVLASAYATTSHSAARDALDEELRRRGFTPPGWYLDIKALAMPKVGSAAAMAAVARAAGLAEIRVDEREVDVGVHGAGELVDYRLGQAQHVAWLAAMPAPRRAALRAELVAAIAPVMAPFTPTVVFLAAKSAG